MNNFTKGDILKGKKRKFKEAWHRVVYISGPEEAPLAFVLTHTGTDEIPCNFRLKGIYDGNDQKPQYFVGHLIQKMSEWGPYHRVGRLIKEDMEVIENTVSVRGSITWAEYETYTKNGCPDHKKI